MESKEAHGLLLREAAARMGCTESSPAGAYAPPQQQPQAWQQQQQPQAWQQQQQQQQQPPASYVAQPQAPSPQQQLQQQQGPQQPPMPQQQMLQMQQQVPVAGVMLAGSGQPHINAYGQVALGTQVAGPPLVNAYGQAPLGTQPPMMANMSSYQPWMGNSYGQQPMAYPYGLQPQQPFGQPMMGGGGYAQTLALPPGSMAYPMAAAPAPLMVNQGPVKCPSCKGHGWRHDNSMPHHGSPEQRCMFCSTCSCGGKGLVEGDTALISGGAMGMGTTTVVHQGSRPCPGCSARGWKHSGSMPHDKGPDTKCFFCAQCPACDGRGTVSGGEVAIHESGFGGAAVVVSMGTQPCVVCSARGFTHSSGMNHDKAPTDRCFFCQNCPACGGKGVTNH